MKPINHIGRIPSLIISGLIALMTLSSCDTSGDNPIGGFLGNTARTIIYWETASYRFAGSAVRSITLDNSNNIIIAVKDSGIFVSSNRGTLWSSISNGLPDEIDILSVEAAPGNVLYAVSDTSAYRYTSAAEGWEPFNQGLSENTTLYGITKSAAGKPFLTSSTGLYTLASDNASWDRITSGLPDGKATVDFDIQANGTSVLVTSDGAVFRSLDGTGGWVPVYLPFYLDSAYSVAQNPVGDLCILLQSRRLAVYSNDSQTDLNQQLFADQIMFFNGIGFLLEVQELNSDPYNNDVKRYKMMRSIDGGINWAPVGAGLPVPVIDLVFDSNGNGYAVGSNGSIGRTLVPIK